MSNPTLVTLNDGTDRDAWLASRLPVITATQAAAIAGSHPYYKLIDVWNEKTDPDHNPDAMRNRWLEERAANGTEREPEIIAWASTAAETGGPGNPFQPDGRLLTSQHLLDEFPILPPAATPDASKYAREDALVLLEAKTTQQDWENDGLPQHIYDQGIWQLYVTGAVTVWIAQERTEWSGRGANRTATPVGRALLRVHPDPVRLAFLLERVAEFRRMVAEGIAPESDLELVTEYPDFDATDEDVAEYEEGLRMDALLTELDELEREMSDKAARVKVIKAELAPIVKAYEGRRVHLVGTRRIVKLTRYWKTKEDTSKLTGEQRRAITSWDEVETVSYPVNPDYVAPTSDPTPTQ